MVYLGLDVHQKQTTVCIQDERGTVLWEGQCVTDAAGFRARLGRWLREHPGSPVGMESCTKAYVVSGIVEGLGGTPHVYAADEVASKTRSRKKKSDGRDAWDLCTNMRTGALQREVRLPGPLMRRLRSVLGARDLLVKQRVQSSNAARSLSREYGLLPVRGKLIRSSGWEQLLNQEMPETVRMLLQAHQRTFAVLAAEIAALTARIEELSAAAEQFAVVESIPGIGPIIRASLAAQLFDIERFAGPKKVSAYLGLCPSSYDSGDRERKGRITREGPRIARSLLVEAAQHTARPGHPLNPYYRRYVVKHGYKRAIVAMANKLCRIVYALVRNQVEFTPALVGVKRNEGDTQWVLATPRRRGETRRSRGDLVVPA